MTRYVRTRAECSPATIVDTAALAWDQLYSALTGRGMDPTGVRAFLESSRSVRALRNVELGLSRAERVAEFIDKGLLFGLTRADVETSVREDAFR